MSELLLYNGTIHTIDPDQPSAQAVLIRDDRISFVGEVAEARRRAGSETALYDLRGRTLIPGFIVDAVCHVPFCAHPSYTQGYYDRDNAFYLEWDRISADPALLNAYLEEWVYGLEDRQAYWEKLGPEVHARLAVEPRLSTPVDYGNY